MKSILIMCKNSPFGTNSALEAIRLGAGFMGVGEDINCKIVFSGDAVLTMRKNLNPSTIGMDGMEDGLEMGDLTDLPIVLIQEDMAQRGMTAEDVIEYEELTIVPRAEIPKIMTEYDSAFYM